MPAARFTDQLNTQIGHELAAHNQYLACAIYYDALTMPRMAGFFYRQAEEERGHALMMVQYLVDTDEVEGKDPQAVYGEHAAAAVRRIDGIANVGDLVVISTYDPETGEIHAFEELIGAHGGLGGAQTRPFLLHPAEWEVDLAPLIGAPMVYQQLRRWMETELGMTFGPGTGSEPSSAAVATRAAGDHEPVDDHGTGADLARDGVPAG